MAGNSIILSLSDSERQALSLCGITRDEQLARLSPKSLLRDMEAAASFFEEEHSEWPGLDRLTDICQRAAERYPLSEKEQEAPKPERTGIPMSGSGFKPSPDATMEHRRSEATGRLLVVDDETLAAAELDERRKKDDPRGFTHAVCNAHPISVYLGAWATWLLIAAIILMVLGVLGMLIGIEFKGPGMLIARGLVAVVIIYLVFLHKATCSTCRMHIYSFHHYPRHKKAHNIPLLGYTLSTALFVILLLRFRCPSCGTPQKLFGHRKHRSRRRH